MADKKLTALTATTAAASTDIIYIVVDPGGTPASKKMEVGTYNSLIDVIGTVTAGDVSAIVATASADTAGVIETATDAEAIANAATNKAVVPANLNVWTGNSAINVVGTVTGGNATSIIDAATQDAAGLIEIATDAEANAMSATNRAIVPTNLAAWTGNTAIASVGTVTAGDVDSIVSTASSDTAGIIETATDAEANAMSATNRAIVPTNLAAWTGNTAVVGVSTLTVGDADPIVSKGFSIPIFDNTTTVTAGNGTVAFIAPTVMSGMNINEVVLGCHTVGSSGNTGVMIRRVRTGGSTDILTATVTLTGDFVATGTVSGTADDVQLGDLFYADVDVVEGTAPTGLFVTVMGKK